MRVAVMGSGAIGLLYGGWLKLGGADVTFVARGARLSALKSRPLVAEGRLPFSFDDINAVADIREIDAVDAILLAVKLYDLQSAALAALPALRPEGSIVAVQNGINVFRELRAIVPASKIAIGPVYSVTRIDEPLRISYGGVERVILGNPECDVPDPAKTMVEIWRRVGVDASVSPEINRVLWMKFVGLATGAAINCLSRLPAGVVYHDEGILEYVRQSIAEVIAVGRAEGIDFPNDTAENTLKFLQSFPPTAVASMRLDLDAGKRLELEGISGELVRLAKAHGIPTPFHSLAYAMLKHFVDGPD
jgi:2-dehydropantoate 2-reductase